jgi:hypothetical protein
VTRGSSLAATSSEAAAGGSVVMARNRGAVARRGRATVWVRWVAVVREGRTTRCAAVRGAVGWRRRRRRRAVGRSS